MPMQAPLARDALAPGAAMHHARPIVCACGDPEHGIQTEHGNPEQRPDSSRVERAQTVGLPHTIGPNAAAAVNGSTDEM